MDDEYTDDIEAHGSSRRDALKKIGIGAGVVWATPVVMSLTTPAGAQVGSVRPDPRCAGATCGSFEACGTPSEPNGLENCFCFATEHGEGFCIPDQSCAAVDTCFDGVCPPGFICAVDTCCGDPICMPLAKCDPISGSSAVSRSANSNGRTASGR